MAAATARINLNTQTIKPKRRRYRETTITATSAASDSDALSSSSSASDILSQSELSQGRTLDTATVVSSENSWCCSAATAKHSAAPPPISASSSPVQLQSDLKIRYSPSALPNVMDSLSTASSVVYGGAHAGSPAYHDAFPSSFSKFNSALTAGLLNPMSPPPPPPGDKARASPTLFEMMASEPDCLPRTAPAPVPAPQIQYGVTSAQNQKPSSAPVLDKQALMQQRLLDLLACRSPGNQFNDSASSDVKLTLSSKDGLSVSMNVHRQILLAHSRVFAVKLSEKWAKQQHQKNSAPYIVEIADCDDIEIYIETLRLMYCKDLRKKLMKEDVPRVLGILKVSAAIGFDAGVLSCLEYLEAAPWAEDEEEKVASMLSELRLDGVGAGEVLKRVSLDTMGGTQDGSGNEEVLLKLLHVVLEGKDEKARREMKSLVSKMLHENSSQSDLRKESLYSACDACLQLLRHHFFRAAKGDLKEASQISRQADNLNWILDILIDRQIAEDFLKTWASQSELSEAHCKVPAIHRHEVSRVTARLFVGIGKGQLLASRDTRCLLLQTWLVPFYEDFGWMRRASKGLDRHLIEDGLSSTILTLPMAWQQEILMAWFNRFLNSGDDCPNIQRGFQIWWKRAFWRRNGEAERPCQMRVVTAAIENK
ncbi:PREDICTED: BTB/POZ domain-containing protein At1g63850-like [Ipomoea nil]|uniref:BTB/POZ domain-containing protein At1g63850-like n=1 Tax=Ipomoea nil TaxID=35883 RepID=UPI0009017444|nr:PREDICTED: BTB/POZ domain-containing protein At1g63850-like [Ipomoea nil]